MTSCLSVTAKVNRRHEAKLKSENGKELSFVHSRNRASGYRRSAVWKFPPTISHQVAKLIFDSVVTRTLLLAVFNHEPMQIMTGLQHLDNKRMIRQYVYTFISYGMSDLRQAVRMSAAMIKTFGLFSSLKASLDFWDFLDNVYQFPRTLAETFCTSHNELDTTRVFDEINKLENRWNLLFDRMVMHTCPFCNKNLKNLKFTLSRHLQISHLKCCSRITCQECMQEFLARDDNYKSCPVCNVIFFKRVIDEDLATVGHSFIQNRIQFENNFSIHRKVVLTPQGATRVGSKKNLKFLKELETKYNNEQSDEENS